MTNLIRMDLYRMWKARSFKVCLVLALLSGFCMMPLAVLFSFLIKLLPETAAIPSLIPKSVTLSSLISDPFPVLNGLLIMFSACYFFYADIEHGYIKNIAGQMPKKGYAVVSRYIALICHNLIFVLAGIIGNVIGHVLFVKLILDREIVSSLGYLGLRLLLLHALCAILLFVTVSLRSKNFGMVLAVVLSSGMMNLIYLSIDSGMGLMLKKTVEIEQYMPDQLLNQTAPKLLPSLAASGVTMAVFLFFAIRLFDKREVR